MNWLALLKFKLGNLVQWTVFVLGLSVVVHGMMVFAAPTVHTKQIMNQLLNDAHINEREAVLAPGLNLLGSQFPDSERFVDVCVFNLSQGPILLTDIVPEGNWSLSLYSESRELLYRLTSDEVSAGDFRALLAGTGQHYDQEDGVREIVTDRFGGLVVFRSDSPRIDPLDLPRCEPLRRSHGL